MKIKVIDWKSMHVHHSLHFVKRKNGVVVVVVPGPKKKKGKKEKKIDIHPNHKSELSQRRRGGEIVVGLVLDYILHRVDTSAACKCV